MVGFPLGTYDRVRAHCTAAIEFERDTVEEIVQ